jgi:hypothetical protein
MPRFTMEDIKRAGGPVTEFHAPFKAEGTDIRNAFGVIVGAAIDEVHANVFAAAPDMLAELKRIFDDWPELDTDEPINGGDMVDWFCQFAERARVLIARAEGR